MPYSLVSAATLGCDLVRLSAGRAVAEVLLTGLNADATTLERLGRKPRPEGTDAVVIVVRLHGEAVSLLVDSIADVVDVDATDFETPPDTLDGKARELIRGADKLSGQLLLALDVQKAVSA